MIERTLKVLFIEDNPGDILLVEEMLHSTGERRIELRSTNRISTAREMMKTKEIDALLLDLGLPDVNGLETLEKIHRIFPDLPIVVLSSLEDEEMAVSALQIGAQDFLVKGTINGHLLTRALFYAIKRKELDSRLLYLATHDSLTGLFNRKFFHDQLNRSIGLSTKNDRRFAVLLLDLASFRVVNDTFGHAVGDQLLVDVARHLQKVVRKGDTVARMGGDEFAVILEDLPDDDRVTEVVDKIRAALCRIHSIDANEIDLDLAIGISRFPTDGILSGELVRKAGRALNLSREAGELSLHFYSPSMEESFKIKKELRSEFSRALKNGELTLHYQPIVNIRTHALTGVEALVRWNHPDRGILSPAAFLPQIMGTELIVSMGEWVLRESLSRLSEWLGQGITLSMCVNVDLLQLRKADFVSRLSKILGEHPSVPHRLLELEIIETSTAESVPNLPEILSDIHAMGVRLAIDDFGTGYSSLAYLKHLPVDTLKIDQGFVIGMRNNRENLAIIESIVSLARIFGRSVVAEGMEEMEYEPLLIKLGCDHAQGYAIGRPMPPEQFLKWRREWMASDGSEKLLPAPPLNELSILSTQVEHFAWIQNILSLAQKSLSTPLTQAEEAVFSDTPAQEWYASEGRADYGDVPAFRELDFLYRETRELSREMLKAIQSRNLEGMRYDSQRLLLSKDSLLALYGTLQKDAMFRSILDRRDRVR